jgi:hypothetical protein
LASPSRGESKGTLRGARPAVASIPGLTTLWAETIGDPQICIAILDAPVDRANPCLERAKIEQRWLGNQGHCSTHGTEVASVILAPHHSSVLGIAPGCRAVSIPIYDCNPDRSPSTDQRQLAVAIHEALAAGAHLINVSAGQLVPTGTADAELSEAVRECASAGVLILAAVGNDGCDCLHVPAALPCVLAVGASRWDGSPLPGSNWGSIYGTQGVLAPGENIPVAGQHGEAQPRTGTSFATAIVSGVVALLLSRERKRGRAIRPLLIRSALLRAAAEITRQGLPNSQQDSTHSRRLLAGRLNIPRVINLLDHWSTTMTDEMNQDLATAGNSQSHNGCDARPAALGLSSDQGIPLPQMSRAPELAAPEPRAREYAAAVEPSACSGCSGERQLVYALGRLNYDFGSEAGLDAFKQRMQHHRPHPVNPYDPWQMFKFVTEMDGASPREPWLTALLWTLEVGGLPLYVIRPEGTYAAYGYHLLLEYFMEQFPPTKEEKKQEKGEKGKKRDEEEGEEGEACDDEKKEKRVVADRVAVPGVIAGQATLYNGQRVPVINPDLRGLRNWNRSRLIKAVLDDVDDEDEWTALNESLREFLDRTYFELQNAGRTPQERALNYAATNLVECKKIFGTEWEAERTLDTIGVERSSIFRPGSDCWDVMLSFFDPELPRDSVRSIHRFTVDVSQVIPVTVGDIRSWKAR